MGRAGIYARQTDAVSRFFGKVQSILYAEFSLTTIAALGGCLRSRPSHLAVV